MLDPFNGVTEGTGGTLLNDVNDGLNRRGFRINPGFSICVEHRLEFIRAHTRMTTNSAIVVNRDLLPDEVLSSI